MGRSEERPVSEDDVRPKPVRKRFGLVPLGRILAPTESATEPSAEPHPWNELGLRTGYQDVDRLLGGFQRSDLVVLLGRRRTGTTALGLSVMLNVCRNFHGRVTLFCPEMPTLEVAQRLLAMQAGVSLARVLRGELSDSETSKLQAAGQTLAQMPLHVCDTPAISIAELGEAAIQQSSEIGLDLVVVDHVQLVTADVPNRSFEVIRSLKALARELDIPVVAISRLSPVVDGASEGQLAHRDLEHVDMVIQHADVVCRLHRDDLYYTEDQWNNEFHDGRPYPKGIGTLGVIKHRHGPTGVVVLQLLERTMNFVGLELRES